MYPTLVAPGTNILSTVPGGVSLMRGSSMATPYHGSSPSPRSFCDEAVLMKILP
jgi:hypothetical protein